MKWRYGKAPRTARRGPVALTGLMMIMGSASCVPAQMAEAPAVGLAASAITAELPPSSVQPLPAPLAEAQAAGQPVMVGEGAVAANASLPIAAAPNPAAASYVFRGGTPIDQMRSLDCLAQAIYYEARSESEDGQRAVAQVVLNRVRHPSWPNSVCGVVYQGPMRAGGGCQFTFTCDGSLAARPVGLSWHRAQRIAAEALAGRTYAGVGYSTHYHTHAVFPAWAPRLMKTAVIGSHNFYRLPGTWGGPNAFSAAYARREPVPQPAMRMVAPAASAAPTLAVATANLLNPVLSQPAPRIAEPMVSDIPQDPRWTATNLPESQVREEYRQSGQWRADSPIQPAQ